MTDPSWNRLPTRRLERSHSASATPTLTWHQTPRIARQKKSSLFLIPTSESLIGIGAISNFVLQGKDSKLNFEKHLDRNSNNSKQESEFDYKAQFDIDPENSSTTATLNGAPTSDASDRGRTKCFRQALEHCQGRGGTRCVKKVRQAG